MVTLLERRRAVEFDNIPSVRISRFSRHFLATRETIFEGDDSKPIFLVILNKEDFLVILDNEETQNKDIAFVNHLLAKRGLTVPL